MFVSHSGSQPTFHQIYIRTQEKEIYIKYTHAHTLEHTNKGHFIHRTFTESENRLTFGGGGGINETSHYTVVYVCISMIAMHPLSMVKYTALTLVIVKSVLP